MSRATRMIAGLILITVPTIEYGGLFLLSSLVDPQSGYAANALRQDLFRAGHAHAGVITILSLVCQVLADGAALPAAFLWLARLGVPVSGILISAGFFLSMLAPAATAPNKALALVYAGALLLAVSLVSLGVGLLRRR